MSRFRHISLVRLGGLIVLMTPILLRSAPLTSNTEEDGASQEIISKYVDATKTQQQSMRGAQMEVFIAAKLPRLEKQGTLQALRTISQFGKITYKALGFSGDNFIKNEVIARYLAAESEVRDPSALAITPANYKFKYKGTMEQERAAGPYLPGDAPEKSGGSVPRRTLAGRGDRHAGARSRPVREDPVDRS